ncbi:MAG: DHA2 family efflux MFS transporter permease subunit [Thermoleophilia bacterium]|nr:DHA2 family efflux MFS transporter permease subunit [Thermoleophilia bacterium]
MRDRIRAHPRYRWLVLVTVASGMMMTILSASIVNIALPAISGEFGSSIPTTAWVATIYMITQATLMPVAGRAGDIYGHKKVFVTGLLVFTAMSVLCAFAWSVHSLIAGRGLMAVGTSGLATMALAYVVGAFPGRERAQALGILGGLMGSAPTVGLVGGGFLVEVFGWRSVFLVVVPLCLIIAPAAVWILKETEHKPEGDRSFDVPGGVLLTIGLFGGLLGLSQGRAWGWTGYRTLACFAIFVVFLALFILREKTATRPMLDLGLFRFRSLVSANVAAFFSSGAFFGSLVLLPFFFQTVAGDSPAAAGLRIAPLALMFLLVAPLGGRLTTRIGARSTPLLGLFIAAAGYVLVSRIIAVDSSALFLSLAIAVMGIGLGLTMAPLTTAALHDVPADKRGVASSLPQMSRFVGGSFGMAIVGTLLSWRVAAHLRGTGLPANQISAGASPADVSQGISGSPAAVTAFSQAFQDVFLFSVIIVIMAIIAASFMPQLKSDRERHRPVP